MSSDGVLIKKLNYRIFYMYDFYNQFTKQRNKIIIWLIGVGLIVVLFFQKN